MASKLFSWPIKIVLFTLDRGKEREERNREKEGKKSGIYIL